MRTPKEYSPTLDNFVTEGRAAIISLYPSLNSISPSLTVNITDQFAVIQIINCKENQHQHTFIKHKEIKKRKGNTCVTELERKYR